MKTWKPAILTMLALLLCAPVTYAGHTEGNGGDGVYRNGELVLRDFIATAKVEAVPDTRAYLEQYPELPQLIRDLAPGNPSFAMDVWSNLVDTHIWLTDAELPLLPAAATSVVAGKADVQIAIRYGQDIVISRPALAQVQDKEYVFLHEALHGLVKDTNSPWHHEKVRSLVRYVRENRGRYDDRAFSSVLEKFGISYYGDQEESASAERALAISLILERGDAQARCAIFNSQTYGFGDADAYETGVYFEPIRGKGVLDLGKWGDYGGCKNETPKAVLQARYPGVTEWLKRYSDVTVAFVYDVAMPKNIGFFDFGVSETLLSQCKEYGQPAALAGVVKAERTVKRAERSLRQLQEGLAGEQDLSVAYILRTYLKALTDEKSLRSIKQAKAHLQEQRDNYRKTVNACRARFGDYLNQ